jgi:hypothetical protein
MQTILTVTQLPWGETLLLTRIERDQLVIFDPRCAPFIRPLVRAADLRQWHTPIGYHWLIVAPATGLPPRLAQHLADITPPGAPEGWWVWEQPALPAPRIVLRSGAPPIVSWDLSSAVIGPPALVLAQATPFQLALLGAQPGREQLAASADPARLLDRLSAIDAPEPTREHLGALALQRVEWARTQQQADADYARRLLADFGPPGTRLSLRLERWWELQTEELFAALEEDLRNGVPPEFQPFYAQRHTSALAARERLHAQIAELDDTIDAQAAMLWKAGNAK